MMKRLTRHGNSFALVIDRGVLDLLEINEKTLLEIKTDGRLLIIVPVKDESRRKRFEAALAKTHLKFSRTFKRLANAADA